MITDKNFIKAFVGSRFFLWQYRDADQWIVYESLPEEGEGCRRKIISFDNETEAKKFFKAYKAKWVKFYKDNFKITGPDVKGNVPDYEGIRESSLKMAERKVKEKPTTFTPVDEPPKIPDSFEGTR